ncbi:ornithine decarboxylase [Thelephora ganbajun]|uniref:Ornithine decarboxylase n=1 Tax=Thelephora ganbajun TaxID=370292 RepID=A0ACB6ZM23_THEGA|nr:ornithine decarboxylase [Thelephora ganbajun]
MRALSLATDGEPDAERAFFVADLSQVYLQWQRWKRCLPEVEPFFAIKSNPDPYILRLLASLGTGFDCASSGEITNVLGLGVVPSRIIFANPCKATSFIRHAAKTNVEMMTFDNSDELYKIARSFPTAKLIIRIHTDDTRALCRLNLKFGASLVAVPSLLAKAKELGLDVIGVSFHVGSGCFDSSAFADAIRRSRAVFDMGRDVGYDFSMLDIGGGFEDATFDATALTIASAINTYFPNRKETGLRIIAEPGRYFVSKAFSLAANVIARRTPTSAESEAGKQENPDAPSVRLYINDGVYGAFNCILFDHQHPHPYVLSMNGSFHVPSSEPLATCSVWGPTCDSMDCVCPVTQLPDGLRVGDWLAFDNMGAYTICAASQFNGFEVSNVIYTRGSGRVANEVGKALGGRQRS